MVFEQIIKTQWIKKKPSYSLLFGIVSAIISFFTAFILFYRVPRFIGIATMFFIVIISVPSVMKLFENEELTEVRGKKRPFMMEHESIIDFFIYYFVGVFLILFIIALIQPSMVFSESGLYGQQIGRAVNYNDLPPPPEPSQSLANTRLSILNPEMYAIFQNNIFVMLVSFLLCFFYGSGALFLITLNASVFAAALASVIRIRLPSVSFLFKLTFIPCNLSIMFLHMLPELSSYLIAAIAGGVLSKAFVRERFMSKRFLLVLKDAVILLIIAIIVLIFAAMIEVAVSKQLFTNNICLESHHLILFAILIIFGIIAVLELFRKKKIFKYKEPIK